LFALTLKDEERHLKDHCCARMTQQVNSFWPLAADALSGSTDQRIYWSSVFDEYGLICQPSAEILKIEFCPFCGAKLPQPRRDKWVERLRELGWKTWGDPIPPGMLRHNWVESS